MELATYVGVPMSRNEGGLDGQEGNEVGTWTQTGSRTRSRWTGLRSPLHGKEIQTVSSVREKSREKGRKQPKARRKGS